MKDSPAGRALAAATITLLVAVGCVALFLPPLNERIVDSVLALVAVGCALAAALLLHGVFLGIAAHRMGRSVPGWVALSLLLFPVGSAAALVLLSWLGDEAAPGGSPAPHHG